MQTSKSLGRGLNTTLKRSFLFPNSNLKSQMLSPNDKKSKPIDNSISSCQHLNDNPTTYDNSVAKNTKNHKSLIKINLLNSPCQKQGNSRDQSGSKRKKFISVTQRGNENVRSCNSQKKDNNFATERVKVSEQRKERSSYINPFSTFRQMLTPTSTLKQYFHQMLVHISRQEKQPKQQEDVLDQNSVLAGRQFAISQKAIQERKSMMCTLVLNQGNKRRQKRVHTQVETRNQRFNTNDYMLITEPECQLDSRNLVIFQEKIGENTLTRKDSLILALMEGFEQSDRESEVDQVNFGKTSDVELLPINNLSPQKQKRPPHLATQPYDIYDMMPYSTQNLRQKISSEQQKQKFNRKPKSNKIKCISLVQKQQQYRYKNCKNQSELKERFLTLKRKTSQKMSKKV